MDASPLLRLPIELRLQIYETLFASTTCTLQIYQHKLHLLRAISQASPLPLLLTSKAISIEAAHALYNVAVFKVHLHVQHLPLIQQQRQLVPDDAKVLEFGGGGGALSLPIYVRNFLGRIRRLELDVWITDSGRTGDMLEQIDAFGEVLGREGELRRFVGRLRWRPRWFSFGGENMTQGQARGLLEKVLEVRSLGRKLIEVDEEMLELIEGGPRPEEDFIL